MKKQISLLLIAVVLNLSNSAQAGAGRFYSTARQTAPLLSRYAARPGGLSQGAVNAARQFSTQPAVPLTTPAMRTYSPLLSKPSGTISARALSTPSTGFDQEQMKSNYGWWNSLKNSTAAKWIAGLLAGSAFVTGSASAEEEAKNPHFEELLKSEYGATPQMVRINTADLWKLLSEDYLNHVNDRAVQKVINLGANVHDRNDNGDTPLLYVTKQRYIWPLYHRDEWETIPEVLIKALIKAGSDVNVKDNKGETPLMNAAKKGYQYGVEALLEAKADVNAKDKDGRTPLMYAQQVFSNIKVIKSLVEKGANVNEIDNNGSTALMGAETTEAAKFLVEQGADVNAQDKDGQTLLLNIVHRLADYNREEPKALIQFLIDKKADVNAKNKYGQTPLHIASMGWMGDIDSARALLDAGADINAKDKDGKTPLDWAKKYTHRNDDNGLINLLKQRGAKSGKEI